MSIRHCLAIPATSANLGPGFDAIGLALDLCNELTFEEAESGVRVSVQGEGADDVDPQDNLVVHAYREAFTLLDKEPFPIHMHAVNRIPFSRGLGSSSAAIVAGLAAAQVMSGFAIPKQSLINLASKLDGHPDNILPAILGGIVIGASDASSNVFYHRMSPPKDLVATVLVPNYPLATKKARAALPTCYSKDDVVYNLGRVGLLVAAFMSGDIDLLKDAMTDKLHEPYRLPLMPGMIDVQKEALENGALAAVVSGAGSTMLFLSKKSLDKDKLLAPLISQGYNGKVLTLNLREHGVLYYKDEMELKLWP